MFQFLLLPIKILEYLNIEYNRSIFNIMLLQRFDIQPTSCLVNRNKNVYSAVQCTAVQYAVTESAVQLQ